MLIAVGAAGVDRSGEQPSQIGGAPPAGEMRGMCRDPANVGVIITELLRDVQQPATACVTQHRG